MVAGKNEANQELEEGKHFQELNQRLDFYFPGGGTESKIIPKIQKDFSRPNPRV